MSLDTKIFSWVHGFSGQSAFLDQVGVFFADQFMFVFVGGVVLLAAFGQYRAFAISAIANLILSRLVIVELLKRFIARPRPFETLDIANLIPEDALRSFPSGHAVVYFSLALAFKGTRLFWPFMILAVIGSIARVFVGVHYPSDVLASFAIALLVAIAVRALFKRLKIV